MSPESNFKDQQIRSTSPEPDAARERLTEGGLKRSKRPTAGAKGRLHGLETDTTQMRLERTKTLLLATRVENVLKEHLPSSDEELRQTFDALITRLLHAEEALHRAHVEHASKIRTVEISLRNECSRRLEALRRSYESELAARAQEIELRRTAEFTAKLARAKAVWRSETEAQLTQSAIAAQNSQLRAQLKWQKRTRSTVRRMAWVWRARERKRLAKAKRDWRLKHREANKSYYRRWKERIVRLKRKFKNPTLPLLPRGSGRWPVPLWTTKMFRTAGLQLRTPKIKK